MLDTTKHSVEDLRTLLVEEYGLSRKEVQALTPKSAVVNRLRELEAEDESVLVGAEEVVDVPEFQVVPTNSEVSDNLDTPNFQDKNWTEYVLGQLYDDELVEKHPTVDGLRRIADKLLGPILQVTSEVVQTPDLNNNFHATVKVTVVTNDCVVDGSADAGGNNCQPKFAIHPVAMAESRAESRAYRKLLRLRNIITAEETVNEDQIIDAFEAVTSTQIKMIDKIASGLEINVEKWLLTHNIRLVDFKTIKKSDASGLCEELNTMRATGAVPEEIKGYDFNWRD